MTRGNQRELARAKAQKKAADMNKGKTISGASLQKRKEQDADALREKQKKKEAEKAAQETAGKGTAAGTGTK